jgi:uncharacterized protein (TIGR00255 family)
MIHSMTGFGRAELTEGDWRCGVELRSVNSRFLEIRLKLPSGLARLEEGLKNVIKAACARGKIDCTITLAPDNPEAHALAVNKPLLQQYARLIEAFREELGEKIEITLGNLTNIKDLILTDHWEENDEPVENLMKNSLGAAVKELLAMRAREGESLQTEMLGRFANIRAIKEEIIPLTRDIPEQHGERLRDNLKRLMGPAVQNEERIFQEIAILADRYDVSEEISRIETHLQHLEQMLGEGGVLGRKFDFLLQELNREANTLAAKSNDVPVSTRVVDIKSELEKLREQVQNIE